MRIRLIELLFLTFLLQPFGSSAPILEVVPQTQVLSGNFASIQVGIADLASAPGAPSVAAFDLGLQFRPDVVAYFYLLFGTYLGTPAETSSSLELGKVLLLSEKSSLSPAELDALQAPVKSTFLPLAVILFRPVGYGTSPLDFTRAVIKDAYGDPISVAIQNGSIIVPEPCLTPILAVLLGACAVFVPSARRRGAGKEDRAQSWRSPRRDKTS